MYYHKNKICLIIFFFINISSYAQSPSTAELKPSMPISQEVNFGEIQNAPATNENEVTESSKVEEVSIDPRIQKVLDHETFYIDLDLNLLQGTVVEDLGVKELQTLENSIFEAWKKLITKEIPQFKNLENFNDLDFKSVEQNPKNVLLLFKVSFKKLPKASIVGKMNLQISASYVLQKLSNKKILSTFDYPQIERNLDLSNSKELSSNVASLIYNLLNAKSQELAASLKNEDQYSSQTIMEVSVKNVKSLVDLTRLNGFVGNLAKLHQAKCKIDTKIKNFSVNSPQLLISYTCLDTEFFEVIKQVKDTPFDNGRLVQFLPDQKTFEIFTQALHNDSKENVTP